MLIPAKGGSGLLYIQADPTCGASRRGWCGWLVLLVAGCVAVAMVRNARDDVALFESRANVAGLEPGLMTYSNAVTRHDVGVYLRRYPPPSPPPPPPHDPHLPPHLIKSCQTISVADLFTLSPCLSYCSSCPSVPDRVCRFHRTWSNVSHATRHVGVTEPYHDVVQHLFGAR